VGKWIYEEAFQMSTTRTKKLIHEGQYAAEVEVELIQDDGAWGPYLSLSACKKLDDVRLALKQGDLKRAARQSRVYSLTPVAV
jgi:hypothetical protein